MSLLFFYFFPPQRLALLQKNFEKTCSDLADINQRYSEKNPDANSSKITFYLQCRGLQTIIFHKCMSKYYLVSRFEPVCGLAGVHMMVLWPYLRPASHWSPVRKLLLSLVHFFSSQRPASGQQSASISWMLLTLPTPGTL